MTCKKVLLIDDDDDVREVAGIALEMTGEFVVRSVNSGEQGITSAQAELPDVILLDCMMPGMDGPTTLSRLRELEATRSVPVIFLTAKVQANEKTTLLATGAAGLIPKPFDPMRLGAQVQELLGALPHDGFERHECASTTDQSFPSVAHTGESDHPASCRRCNSCG